MTGKRFLRVVLPLLVSGLATAVSVVFAVAGGGSYDPTIAVITATLIAMIWTAHFTYMAATREEPTYLTLALEYDVDHRALRPLINNPTTRLLTVRITLDVWAGPQWLADFGGRFYRGAEPLPLGRRDGFGGWLEIPAMDGDKILARMSVRWEDDLGNTGEAGPRHWLIEIPERRISAVIASDELTKHFGGLSRTSPQPDARIPSRVPSVPRP